MSQAIFDAFRAAIRAKLVEACQKFDVKFKPEDVVVRLDIRGSCGGQAGVKANSQYYLRFNHEAILTYNEDMTKNTIPHEVAHLVCFDQRTDKGHGFVWKSVCRRLGGDDSRTHDMTLTPAKVVESRRVDYKLPSGRICRVGPKHHKQIQAGRMDMFMRNPKEYIRAEYWVDFGKVATPVQMAASQPRQIPGLNIVRSDIPALPQSGSKREKAEIIYKANKHLARGDVIRLFVAHAEMTLAGAATYYQNFRKAGI